MSQLVLPHTIDAGTEIVAVEHQANYTAIRDLINGNLEGGGGADNNLKANGVTARELGDDLLHAFNNFDLQEGVYGAGDYKVTPGAGLVLNWAAGSALVRDTAGVLTTSPQALLPVSAAAGASVTIAANASGNPRIDQIILTVTGYRQGTVSVLQGTATAGATLDNRNGAAALPAGAIRLADILMPNAFAGPFVQNTHIRDRRGWMRGFFATVLMATGANLNPNSGAWAAMETNWIVRGEFQGGNPVSVSWSAEISGSAGNVRFGIGDGVAGANFIEGTNAVGTGDTNRLPVVFTGVGYPSAGSHLVVPSYAMVTAGSFFIYRDTVGGTTPRAQLIVQEHIRQNTGNTGA